MILSCNGLSCRKCTLKSWYVQTFFEIYVKIFIGHHDVPYRFLAKIIA